MVGANVVAAPDDLAARRLFTTAQQQFINLFRGIPSRLQPPLDDIDTYGSSPEKAGVDRALKYAMVGSRTTVQEQLEAFIRLTRPDEIMITAQIFDHGERLRSFEIAAELFQELKQPAD